MLLRLYVVSTLMWVTWYPVLTGFYFVGLPSCLYPSSPGYSNISTYKQYPSMYRTVKKSNRPYRMGSRSCGSRRWYAQSWAAYHTSWRPSIELLTYRRVYFYVSWKSKWRIWSRVLKYFWRINLDPTVYVVFILVRLWIRNVDQIFCHSTSSKKYKKPFDKIDQHRY
jgi:hypothetical protein